MKSKQNKNQFLVSVCVQTYQHKDYIKKCLDSILMQKTDFPIELILGEDDSTDGTRQICIEYAKKYPDIIRLFLRKRKDVIHILGKPTGRFNVIENIKAAKGKYIAMCEGDDYWTDSLKLQKQTNFLEENKDFSICFHKIKILKNNVLVNDFITIVPKEVTSLNDLIHYSNFIHTPSVCFRNYHIKFPKVYYKTPVGDYPLYCLLAQYGNIKYIDEEMAVYRYGSGIYSTKKLKEKHKRWIVVLRELWLHFRRQNKDISTLFLKKYIKSLKHIIIKYNSFILIKEFCNLSPRLIILVIWNMFLDIRVIRKIRGNKIS